jgi:hypothetical protein
MTFGLIKNTNRHNKGEDINNDLKNVPCQRMRHSSSHPNNSLPIIIENKFFLKLKCLFKKDNFAYKSIKKKEFFKNLLLIETN